MNFGQALEEAKNGKLIQRKGWNGKGMFVFERPSDAIPVDVVVEKVKSLPPAVKEYFKGKNGLTSVQFNSYLCLKGANDEIVNGWLASQTDLLANDWAVISNDRKVV